MNDTSPRRGLAAALLTTALLLAPAGAQAPAKPPAQSTRPVADLLRQLKLAEDRRAGVDELMPLLEDGRPAVRSAACRALGQVGEEVALIPLSEKLADPDGGVRLQVIRALAWVGSRRCTHHVLASTRSSIARERAASAFGLGLLARVDSQPLDAAATRQRRAVLTRLSELLADDARAVRIEAALAIGFLKLPEAIGVLAEALRQTDDLGLRWRLIYAIGRIGGTTATPILATVAAEAATPWSHELAAQALARISRDPGDPKAAAPLRRLAVDPRWLVAAPATAGLGRHDSDASRAVLRRALAHPSWHVRRAATSALARIGGRADLDRLERALDHDPSRSVRAAALAGLVSRGGARGLAALDRLQAAGASPYLLQPAVTALAGLMQTSPDLAIRKRCIAVYERSPTLLQLALIDGLQTASDSQSARAILLDALGHADLAVRGAAAGALKDIGDPTLLPALVGAYRASSDRKWYEVRETLVGGIGKIGGSGPAAESAAIRALRKALEDPTQAVRNAAVRELEQLLRAKVTRLRKALQSRDPKVKAAAAQELKQLRDDPIKRPEKVKGDPPRPAADPFSPLPRRPQVLVETDRGDLVITLYPEVAPVHVRNLLQLVGRGFYDGLVWHRVVSAFVAQGGDPRGDGWGDPGYTLRDELSPLRYVTGTLGMPKAGKDTGGCQLFLTHLPTPHLDGRYTIFGQVTRGMGTVDRLEVGDRILRARRIR